MAVQAALELAIHAVAPNATINLALINGRLSGMVVAGEFEDMTHLERQRSVWKRIREVLGPGSGGGRVAPTLFTGRGGRS